MSLNNELSRRVSQIIERLTSEGDRALKFYVRKFDGISMRARDFSVRPAEMEKAFHSIPPSTREALKAVYKRIKFFHKSELKRISRSWEVMSDGIRVGQKAHPLDSA